MHQALPLATHETIKRLKAIGFTEQQAEAQTRILAELVDEQLVTKAFLSQWIKELEKSLEESIVEFKAETIKSVPGLPLAQGAVIATLARPRSSVRKGLSRLGSSAIVGRMPEGIRHRWSEGMAEPPWEFRPTPAPS